MITIPITTVEPGRATVASSEKEQFDYSRWFDDLTDIQREMTLRSIAGLIQHEAEILSYRLDDLHADIESIDLERYSDLKTISHLVFSAAEILSKINGVAAAAGK